MKNNILLIVAGLMLSSLAFSEEERTYKLVGADKAFLLSDLENIIEEKYSELGDVSISSLGLRWYDFIGYYILLDSFYNDFHQRLYRLHFTANVKIKWKNFPVIFILMPVGLDSRARVKLLYKYSIVKVMLLYFPGSKFMKKVWE